jgi:pimeloyl-ACP methyl ester carboxylesterase
MTEPTRPIPQPKVDRDGSMVGHTIATPKAFKVRALMTVPPSKVIPVIFVPGIMGTNLKVRSDLPRANEAGLRPGEPAWRPPNGKLEGFMEAWKWSKRDAAQRQRILDPDSLEVDSLGALPGSGATLTEAEMRERGWGQVHAESYGAFLARLQEHLDSTFELNGTQRKVRDHWQAVMNCDPARWGVRDMPQLTELDLEKYAGYHYPVYAVGYNWLASCALSAVRLRKHVEAIIKHWTACKCECQQVILVTHSMGGLVARACARQIPDRIAGIIHGVMPAFGAPVAYQRIACGTEGGRFENDLLENASADGFAAIAGGTARRARTAAQPVLSAALADRQDHQHRQQGGKAARPVEPAARQSLRFLPGHAFVVPHGRSGAGRSRHEVWPNADRRGRHRQEGHRCGRTPAYRGVDGAAGQGQSRATLLPPAHLCLLRRGQAAPRVRHDPLGGTGTGRAERRVDGE